MAQTRRDLVKMFSRPETAATALLIAMGLLRTDGIRHEEPVTL